MAIIGKIREKSILLVIIIGLALLAFILSDWKGMLGNDEGEYGVGHVFGEKIDESKTENLKKKFGEYSWEYYVDSVIMNKEYEALGINVTDKELQSFLSGNEKEGFESIFSKYFSNYPSQRNIQNILDVKGAISWNKVIEKYQASQGNSFGTIVNIVTQLTQPPSDENNLIALIAQAKKNKKEWTLLKEIFINVRKKEKYEDLISQGIFSTTLEAQDKYNGDDLKKTIRYVVKNSNSIADSDIKFKESDLLKYYSNHKYDAKYQNQDAFHKIKYFSLSDAPSGKDSLEFYDFFDNVRSNFANAENDSSYADSKSELGSRQSNPITFYNSQNTIYPENHPLASQGLSSTFILKNGLIRTYNKTIDSVFKSSQVGEVVGPYFAGTKMQETFGKNYYAMYKILGTTPSKIKVRHALLTIAEGQDSLSVMKQAQDLATRFKSKTGDKRDEFFNDTLKKYTKDLRGVYQDQTEWTLFEGIDNTSDNQKGRNHMLYGENVSNYCVNAPIGSIDVIESTLGFHIIEVLERDETKLPKVATIYREFKPSYETMEYKDRFGENLIRDFKSAFKKFENNSDKRNYFDSVVANNNYIDTSLSFKLLDNRPSLNNNQTFNSMQLEEKFIKLAYKGNSKVGSLSAHPINIGNTYIIAMIYDQRSEGSPHYNEIREELKKDYFNEKKKEIIKKNWTGKSIDELALTESIKPDNISFNRINVDIDAGVVGSLFSVNSPKKNTITKPILGEDKVYVIAIDSVSSTPKESYNLEKKKMNSSLMNQVKQNNTIVNGLYEKANVIDNRKLRKFGIRY